MADAAFERLWGDGEKLGALAMGTRALVMFFVVLVLVRLSGARTFGKKTAFDNAVVIMLGAVAARGIVGASPFGSAVAAGSVLAGVHWVLARLCVKQDWLGSLLKGERVELYSEGRFITQNLVRTNISKKDLLESHRLETQESDLSPDEEAFLERNGRISFVKRTPPHDSRPPGTSVASSDPPHPEYHHHER
jgi:uncharacterized membrane protein YcaP (DUF421 family)